MAMESGLWLIQMKDDRGADRRAAAGRGEVSAGSLIGSPTPAAACGKRVRAYEREAGERSSRIVRPESNHFYGSDFFVDFVDKTMLDIDAPRVFPGEVSNQLLIFRRAQEGIDAEKFKQRLRF